MQLLGRHAVRSLGIRHPVLLSGGSRLFWSHVRDERESNLDARFEVLVLADRTVGQLRVHAPKAPELALHARVLPQRRTHRERLGRLKVGVALLPVGCLAASARRLKAKAKILAVVERLRATRVGEMQAQVESSHRRSARSARRERPWSGTHGIDAARRCKLARASRARRAEIEARLGCCALRHGGHAVLAVAVACARRTAERARPSLWELFSGVFNESLGKTPVPGLGSVINRKPLRFT